MKIKKHLLAAAIAEHLPKLIADSANVQANLEGLIDAHTTYELAHTSIFMLAVYVPMILSTDRDEADWHNRLRGAMNYVEAQGFRIAGMGEDGAGNWKITGHRKVKTP